MTGILRFVEAPGDKEYRKMFLKYLPMADRELQEWLL